MRTTGCGVELPAYLQNGIAQLFRGQTPPVEAPIEFILRIFDGICFLIPGLGCVGTCQNNLLMQSFQAPTAFDEARRQIVEEFRMSREFAALSEIIRSVHQSAAEMPKPDA